MSGAASDAARAELSSHARPKRFYLTSGFPLTAAGKVDRRALVARLTAGVT